MFIRVPFLLPQMLSQKTDDLVAVDINPGLFAQRVVSAGNFRLFVFDAVFTQGAATLKIQATVSTTVFGSFIDLSTLDGTTGFTGVSTSLNLRMGGK